MTGAQLTVLFVCQGNSARSIMAESILNRLASDKFNAFSAGSHPRSEINPFVVRLLRSLNHDIDTLYPKDWQLFAREDAPRLDFVFTVCDNAAGEVCPVWPGQPMSAHWGQPDPAAVEGSEAEKRAAFADAYRMLQNRITIFSALPLASIDKLLLQKKIDDIGKMRRDPSAEGAA